MGSGRRIGSSATGRGWAARCILSQGRPALTLSEQCRAANRAVNAHPAAKPTKTKGKYLFSDEAQFVG